jgi:hypothetical protein
MYPFWSQLVCKCRPLVVTGSDEALACRLLNQKPFLFNEVAPCRNKGCRHMVYANSTHVRAL